ncbi:hypothetical protein K2173_028349 [Erythroxylum novogranatense]|uniref:Uncharacterized protein n=1 Tax=Erythroxylum novogranatense TaxID=1862640 RepID=A0AAV8U1K5_9ROSI|nr:hypothetical protein K2173_028349 [Erythroxylum novogranatense]
MCLNLKAPRAVRQHRPLNKLMPVQLNNVGLHHAFPPNIKFVPIQTKLHILPSSPFFLFFLQLVAQDCTEKPLQRPPSQCVIAGVFFPGQMVTNLITVQSERSF